MEVNLKVNWSGRGHFYTDEEIQTVVSAMKEADPQTQGKYQAAFEKKFSEKFQLPPSFAVTSCAAALELSAILTRIGPGDEVICPAHTFAVSAIPFARQGAKLKWADIDPETFLATAKTIEPLITPKTKVIVVVHLYGLACDMDPIMALAKKHNLLVVEDVAQAIGAKDKGRYAGSIGDFGCFSFHTHKNMTTLGEGGILCVKDPELAKVAPGFRHNGMRPFEGERPYYWQPAMSNVDFDWEGRWPYNFCIGEVQCALGSALVDRVQSMNTIRQQRYHQFTEAMKDYPELVFQKIPQESESAHHLLPARYDGQSYGKNRDDLMKLMAFEYGVKVVVQYYPLYRYSIFKRSGFGEAQCPETDRFFDNMLSFPFHYHMSESDFSYMIDVTRKSLETLRK